MKKDILTILILSLSWIGYSQDTIKNIVFGTCENDYGGKILTCSQNNEISIKNDSLYLYGQLGGNCGQTHMIVINRINSNIKLQRLDTGELATCTCHFCYNFGIKYLSSDSFLIFQNNIYDLINLSNLNININEISKITYSNNRLIIEIGDGSNINLIEIYSMLGKLILKQAGNKQSTQELYISSNFGLYVIKVYLGNKTIVKKIII